MSLERIHRYLMERRIYLFSLNRLEIPLWKPARIYMMAAGSTKISFKNFFSRIERGKFCRYNFRDENVSGLFLIPDGVFAYWSALHKYGFTEQFPNPAIVQTGKFKKDKTVLGVDYKFIRILHSKQTEINEEGFGNHKYLIAIVEKTIADCFDLPQYSGGYAELIRKFNEATMNGKKLIAACKANNSIAVTKRMGYLAALFKKNELAEFIRYAQKQINEKI